MTNKKSLAVVVGLAVLTLGTHAWVAVAVAAPVTAETETTSAPGICVVLGLPKADRPAEVVDLAGNGRSIVFFQSSRAEAARVREAAEDAGLLGRRIFVAAGDCGSIQLADNLAHAVLVGPSAKDSVTEKEILRVLHPAGQAILGDRRLVKPFPDGTDAWSHPHHGPDNNPQSRDQLARAPYLTQFLAEPLFCPTPTVTVASAGRVFKAFGHLATHANQNEWLNTLLCVNAYNGIILWQRQLKEGFMIYRNTTVATPETLYLADDESCKLIDARTGRVRSEIVIPASVADGPVWKWMALEDGVLYALIGGEEVKVATRASADPRLGSWPIKTQEESYRNYVNPKTAPGFGRTFVAVDPKSGRIRWSHREQEYVDSRGVCMKNGRIYFYSPQKHLACFDAKEGKLLWRTSDNDLLKAIGPMLHGRISPGRIFFSETSYIRCNDRFVFLAGYQRPQLVAVSAEDGNLVWKKPIRVRTLVLRDDALYAARPGAVCKIDLETGKESGAFLNLRACARAAGSVDSIFYRCGEGTARLDVASGKLEHIAPMRPPCIDGVIISEGLLYWGPWMCQCPLSLYGHICLGPAGEFDGHPATDDSRLQVASDRPLEVAPLEVHPDDWPAYRGDSRRTAVTQVAIPKRVRHAWTYRSPSSTRPTAPVMAGGLVFVADRSGAVRALSAAGKVRWTTYTDGAIFFPPTVSGGRLYVGSADGRVHAMEAATGRLLWAFRVAPAAHRIPVYGELLCRWPVAGGVVVHDGVVYAAAGIAHYDGTYVVALDAVTGKVRWQNNSSGTISEKVDSGISLQGNLHISNGELRFLGGNVYGVARYDLATGKCLNPPHELVNARFATAFYPYYPKYGRYIPLNHTFDDGTTLNCQASYDGGRHTPLVLWAPRAPITPNIQPPVTDQAQRRQPPLPPKRETLWQNQAGRKFNSYIVTRDALLAAGEVGSGDAASPLLASISVKDGSDVWSRPLPAAAVKGGTAIDHNGRIAVSLEDGRVLCFQAVQ